MAAFRPTPSHLRLIPCVIYRPLSSSPAASARKRRVFSGIQPTGIPHLGNYLGAIRPWVQLQQQKSSRPFVSIVDLHALTGVNHEGSQALGHRVFEMAAVLMACGIEPEEDTVLFQQSGVRGHTELAWILNCLCPTTRVESQPQWRERQVSWRSADLTLGLLSYPVLQAADILLYRATHVPVGEDQIKHLELARFLVDRFHQRFSVQRIFPRPLAVVGEEESISRICSLRRPDKKMSKSDPDPASRIELTDSDDAVRKKVRAAVTDSIPGGITFDPVGRPGVANLIRVAASVDGQPLPAVIARLEGSSKLELKDHVTEIVLTCLRPIRARLADLMTNQAADVRAALEKGNRLAQSEADETMTAVRGVMKLRP